MAYNPDYNQEFVDSRISKINAAGLINLILSGLWTDAYRHSRMGDFSKWNADLNCLWIEFAGDVKPGSEDEKEFESINARLAAIGSLSTPTITGFKQLSTSDLIKRAKQYQILLEKSVFLKRMQNKQGKGTAYYDEAEDDWE